MQRFRFGLIALLLTCSAYAMDTYRFGSRLVEVGDNAAKLVELAGQPMFKEPLESKSGAYEGERWQYHLDDITVTFVIKNGKIDSIAQVHD